MFSLSRQLAWLNWWSHASRAFDKETCWAPDGKTDLLDEQKEPAICCAFCQHPVTNQKSAIDVAGAHRHTFVNPAEVTFEIAMYEQADCIALGPATEEHTWFSGYAWKIAVCTNCKAHLGWYYHRVDSHGFFGLIVDHLVEN